MCGLIGYSGKENFDRSKIEILLLWNGLLRGEDSTGIYTPKNNTIKSAQISYKFLRSETEKFEDDNLLIGHVRAATIGSISKTNTHPFNEGNVVLAHNGTLSNHYDLLSKYDLAYSNFSVDSHIVCGALNKAQNYTPLSEINGAAAMLIGDKNTPNLLYVFKNKERPLFYGMCNKNMYISSLEESLVFIGCSDVKAFEDDKLYVINKGAITKTTPIVNNPYKRPNYISPTQANNGNLNGLNVLNNLYLFKGCWVRSTATKTLFANNETSCIRITFGKWYFVTGYDQVEKELTVIDDAGNRRSLGIFNFDYNQSILKQGALVKLLENIVNRSKEKKRVFSKDEVVLIDTIDFKERNVVLESPVDGYYYSIGTENVRRLSTSEETEWYNNQKSSSCGINNKEETTNTDSRLPSILDKQEETLDNDSEESDEETDDVYYDLEINSERLADVLDKQLEFGEELLQFSKQVADEEKFLDVIRNMEAHLLEAASEFELEENLINKNNA